VEIQVDLLRTLRRTDLRKAQAGQGPHNNGGTSHPDGRAALKTRGNNRIAGNRVPLFGRGKGGFSCLLYFNRTGCILNGPLLCKGRPPGHYHHYYKKFPHGFLRLFKTVIL
jgi:hypothetical protein